MSKFVKAMKWKSLARTQKHPSLLWKRQPFSYPTLCFSSWLKTTPDIFFDLFSFGKGNLADFWKGVAKSGDDKLVGHPMKETKGWEDLCIPIYVHGDGVDFTNNDSLMVFSWGSLLSNHKTLLSHWLLACFPKSCGTKETWEAIWKWLGLVLQSIGIWPPSQVWGQTNEPLEKGSMLASLAGPAIASQKNERGFVGHHWWPWVL